MTDNEMRVAIAEACGWRWRRANNSERCAWFDPSGNLTEWTMPIKECVGLPDYPNDLNAMHEAVIAAKIPDKQWSDALMRVIQDETCCGAVEARYATANATARQRAEAFLRTVGGWKE